MAPSSTSADAARVFSSDLASAFTSSAPLLQPTDSVGSDQYAATTSFKNLYIVLSVILGLLASAMIASMIILCRRQKARRGSIFTRPVTPLPDEEFEKWRRPSQQQHWRKSSQHRIWPQRYSDRPTTPPTNSPRGDLFSTNENPFESPVFTYTTRRSSIQSLLRGPDSPHSPIRDRAVTPFSTIPDTSPETDSFPWVPAKSPRRESRASLSSLSSSRRPSGFDFSMPPESPLRMHPPDRFITLQEIPPRS